jgi:hypothetical protein
MGIRQLREQAALRGVSSSGSKKELLERLCEDSKDQDLKDIPEGMEESLTFFFFFYVIGSLCSFWLLRKFRKRRNRQMVYEFIYSYRVLYVEFKIKLT